ncbi:MAG: hypothetical protein LQ344_004663 [Seirophora lacunosa]|nr:MAG: hypothetical protein LQ344_004663 [Seirophora lacunosa]
MDPGYNFVEEVIQHAVDGLRSVLNRDGQVPYTTDEALTNALRQCFLEKIGLDLEDLEAVGRRDLEVIVAALQPRLISRIYEGIFNLPPATASVQASGETSTGIRPAASVPANTAPATDNQPIASVLAHTDMSIGTDSAGSQAVYIPERSLRAIAEKVLHSTGRYGIQKPVTILLSALEELAARVGRLAVRIVTSPGLVLAFAVVGLGLVNLDIRFDNSTNEVLNHSGKIYEKLGSDIAQYSREAESLFQLFTISKDRVNRTFQMGEFEEAKRWYDNILALLPTLAKGKAEESAFNAHTNTVLPRLRQVLATGERIDEKISFLQSQEAQSVSQLRGVEQTLQLLHPQASRIRSILDYLLGVAAGPTQTTGQYVKALTDKPRKVYLTLMRSAFQQAKNALQSWAYEDKRHGDFLFDSLEDRLASLFQVYAWEEMH